MKTYKHYLPFILHLAIFLSILSPNMALSQEHQVIKVEVGKGGSVWTATRKIAKLIPMQNVEYNKTWNKSYIQIGGKNTHISKVDLVFPETIILWKKMTGIFEIEGKKIGTRHDLMVAIKKARKGRKTTINKGKKTRISFKKTKKSSTTSSKKKNDSSSQEENEVKLPVVLADKKIESPSTPNQASKKIQVEEILNDLIIEEIAQKPSTKIESKNKEEVIDDTKTGAGKEFYKHFVSQWVLPETNFSTISIVEKASILDGVHVFITVDGAIIYKTFIEPENHIIEALAKEGARATKTYIMNKEQGL